MRLIIAGSRDLDITFHQIDVAIAAMGIVVTEEVSGRSGNVDLMGEQWAYRRGLHSAHLTAKWKLGDSAGPLRNKAMALYAFHDIQGGALLAFWDGKSKGTKNMIEEAKKLKLIVKVVEVT